MQVPVIATDTFPHLPDSLVRGVTATIPGGGKLAAVLVIGLVLVANIILILAAVSGFRAAGGVKKYLADFPSHNASTALGLVLVFETGLVILIRLALGLIFPEGYDTWLWVLAAILGINVTGLGIKRATDQGYVEAKARGKAAGAPLVGPVEGDVTMTTTTERPVPAPSRKTDVMPQAGVKPSDPAVVQQLETYAARQRGAITAPPTEASD